MSNLVIYILSSLICTRVCFLNAEVFCELRPEIQMQMTFLVFPNVNNLSIEFTQFSKNGISPKYAYKSLFESVYNYLSFLYLLFWCIDINDSKEKLNSSDQSAINKKYISAIIPSVYYIIFQQDSICKYIYSSTSKQAFVLSDHIQYAWHYVVRCCYLAFNIIIDLH